MGNVLDPSRPMSISRGGRFDITVTRNEHADKTGRLEMEDLKVTAIKIPRCENAGYEIERPNCNTWKCNIWKRRTNLQDLKIQDIFCILVIQVHTLHFHCPICSAVLSVNFITFSGLAVHARLILQNFKISISKWSGSRY